MKVCWVLTPLEYVTVYGVKTRGRRQKSLKRVGLFEIFGPERAKVTKD
jgi:hypothetical protein